jgi:protein phosphatase
MDSPEAKIQCSNQNCQASNSHNNQNCFRCGNPIVKRYLRAIGKEIEAHQQGHLLGDRYLVEQARVILDTKPGLPPQIPEEIPAEIVTYLQLYPYRLHIPQVYGQFLPEGEPSDSAIWLLEYASLPTGDSLQNSDSSGGELKYPQLLPQLKDVWQNSKALRQLNWLWQIARLWQPLLKKSVASTLVEPSLLRVNGAIVQLLELKVDGDRVPTLKQLGQSWSKLIIEASGEISEFLQELCYRLETQEIIQSEQLVALLERAIERHRRFYQYIYQIYTSSDSGPTRKHNEDACYPASNELIEIVAPENPLVVVCDGIGGHEGGEIASGIAIDSLKESVAKITFDAEHHNPVATQRKLAQFTNAANDAISERNDSEQRQDRQRMGTTLVMALANYHQMYLTHVGDSRIYWINSDSCHQVTVDDDLASREVRMGYALYRDAIQYPSAGALVQALGMRESQNLHPNVQRMIWDEDCVFLLCTDGLSDFDRVEQHWQSTIVPVIQGKSDISQAGKNLIKIANEKNGHDNATVGLIYCQIKSPAKDKIKPLSWSEVESAALDYILWSEAEEFKPIIPTLKIADEQQAKIENTPEGEIYTTSPGLFPAPEGLFPTREQAIKTQKSKRNFYLTLAAIVISLLLGSAIALFFPKIKSKLPILLDNLQKKEVPEESLPPNSEQPETNRDSPPVNPEEIDPTTQEKQIEPNRSTQQLHFDRDSSKEKQLNNNPPNL